MKVLNTSDYASTLLIHLNDNGYTMQSFSIGQFSLEYWKSLTDEAQTSLQLGEYNDAEMSYGQALTEAQKLIDDLSLSAFYEHSARLYKTACYNLAQACHYQGKADDAFHYHQLAHIQIQQFADNQQLTEVTRYCALQVLDTTIVTLLEHYQNSQITDWKKYADALISEHVHYMEKHDNKNLPKDLQEKPCGQCEDCTDSENNIPILH
jgi:tetratricopeptide (TPR) repeat protein